MRQALRLGPERLGGYDSLATYALALQRFDEAGQIIHEAQARKSDHFLLHLQLYGLGFVASDARAIGEQALWFAGMPEYENYGLGLASDSEAYLGHLWKARELTHGAEDSALRTDNKEVAAIWHAHQALREAAVGNALAGREATGEALKLASTRQGVEIEAALASAMAGDTARAESLAQDLNQRFPLDTQMQSLWLPAIRAQLALDKKNPTAALTALQTGSAIEFGQIPFFENISCLYPVYVRGEAYLAADRAVPLLASFRRFSITAASSGTAGREPWRIWAWRVRTHYGREILKVLTPTLPASVRLRLIRTSSPFGKTPIPTSPS